MTEAKISDPHHSDTFKWPGNPHLLHNLQLPLTVADSESALAQLRTTCSLGCFYLNVTIEGLDRVCWRLYDTYISMHHISLGSKMILKKSKTLVSPVYSKGSDFLISIWEDNDKQQENLRQLNYLLASAEFRN